MLNKLFCLQGTAGIAEEELDHMMVRPSRPRPRPRCLFVLLDERHRYCEYCCCRVRRDWSASSWLMSVTVTCASRVCSGLMQQGWCGCCAGEHGQRRQRRGVLRRIPRLVAGVRAAGRAPDDTGGGRSGQRRQPADRAHSGLRHGPALTLARHGIANRCVASKVSWRRVQHAQSMYSRMHTRLAGAAGLAGRSAEGRFEPAHPLLQLLHLAFIRVHRKPRTFGILGV